MMSVDFLSMRQPRPMMCRVTSSRAPGPLSLPREVGFC